MEKHNKVSCLKAVKNLIERNRGKSSFPEHDVKRLLKEIGLSVPEGVFISREMAEDISSYVNIPYPLVVKVSSSRIVSKSDVNGVRVGIRDEIELKRAVSELLQINYAEGVLVEEMVQPGLEIIVGGIVDEQFGPVVMFGLGGVFVELFQDVAFAMAPLNMEGASWLIKQVAGYKLLEGYRGKPPADIDTLLQIIIVTSELISTGLIKELDLNPVALYPKGAVVMDAKMLVPLQLDTTNTYPVKDKSLTG